MPLVKKYKIAVFPSQYVDGDVVVWYSPQLHMFILRYATDGEGVKTLSYGDKYYKDVAAIVIKGRRIACTPLKDRS